MKTETFCNHAIGFLIIALPTLLIGHQSIAKPVTGYRPQVIYGDDNRIEVFQAANAATKTANGPELKWDSLAKSTVAVFSNEDIEIDQSLGTANLSTQQFSEEYNLCKEEPFFEQPTGPFCSGSLVGEDLILTAGHCIADQFDCDQTAFVFGFDLSSPDKKSSIVSATEVYRCKEVVARTYEVEGADFALIRTTSKVAGHAPLKLNRSGSIQDATPLVLIGHPAGLPTKIAAGASVRSSSQPGFFVANTDSYTGNSGSAVFNASTGLIEGVLVRGEKDFVTKPGDSCRISYHCTNEDCRGEDVTKISEVLSFVPEVN